MYFPELCCNFDRLEAALINFKILLYTLYVQEKEFTTF